MLLEECTTFSVWQRKTVPTIKVHPPVDDAPSLQQTRLQEVIDQAPHYSKVLILGGTYSEQLMISKAIEICGEDGDEPVISSRGPTITVNSDVPCFFASLKIKTKSISTASTRTDPPAITMSTGKAVFFRCEMTSLYVCGTAQPVIERCIIQGNGGGSGLVVRDSAGGSYLTNEITDHSLFCLEVLSRGKPKFVNNDIHTSSDDPNVNPGTGLLRISGGGAGALAHALHGEVAPTFIGNKFQDSFSDEQRNNAQAVFGSDTKRMFYAADITTQRVSIAIEYANPTFKNNSMDGGVVAMSIIGGVGSYVSNTVQLSMLCGVFVSRGSQAKFENNKFTQHGGGGVYIDGCSPVITACNIVQCRGVGISVNNSKDFLLNSCLVEKNRVGISIMGSSGGTVKENQIQRNELIGFRASDLGVRTLVADNLFQMNGGCGVYILAGAMPRILRNTIHSQKAGLVASSGSFPTVTDNHIYGNEQFAVSVQERTRGIFQKNKLANGAVAAVKVTDHSSPLFEENRIDEATVGILVSTQATGRFLNNTLRGHGDGIHLSTFADPLIEGNQFQNCSRYGAFCVEDALGTITNNTFTNTMIGLGCFKGAQTLFRANVIETALQVGGVLGEESRGVLEKNTFNESRGHGLVLTGYLSKSRVRKCNFHSSQGYGVLSEKQGAGIVEHCFFSGNQQAGFGSEEEGETVFRHNRSLEDAGPGMLCTNNGSGTFLHNVIEESRTVGCRIDGNARPLIQHCSFLRCFTAGIVLEEGAEGEILDCVVEGNRIGMTMKGAGCKTKISRTLTKLSIETGMTLGSDVQVVLTACVIEDQPIGARLHNCGPAFFESCTIDRCGKGMVCDKAGSATLHKCIIRASTTCLLELSDGGHLTAKECTFSGSEGTGISAKSKCKGHFVETKVLGCKEIGVLMEHNADPKFELCTISENNIGIQSRESSAGVFADTSIIENRSTNVICRVRCTTLFTKCIIAICQEGPGVVCGNDGSRFTDCQIQRNATHGFLLETASRTIIRGCIVQHNKMSGLYCLPRSEPTSNGCKLIENEHSGIVIAGGASPTLTENELLDNADGGVLCLPGSIGLLQRNTIKGNHLTNIRLLDKSATAFVGNTITGGKDCGLIVEGSACRLDGNTISHHNHAAVYVTGPSDVELVNNSITHNSNGIVFEAVGVRQFRGPLGIDLSQQNVEEQSDTFTFRGSPKAGSPRQPQPFSGMGGAQKSLTQGGISNGSSAIVTENTFAHNKLCAIVLMRKASPTISQNSFHDGEVGVKILTTALGSIENNTFVGHKVAAMQIYGNLIETRIRLNSFEKNEIGIEIRHNNRTSAFVAGKGWTPSQNALGVGKADHPSTTPGGTARAAPRKKKTLLDSVAIMFAAGSSLEEKSLHPLRSSLDDPLEQSDRRNSRGDDETDSLGGGSSFDDGSSNSSSDSDDTSAATRRRRRRSSSQAAAATRVSGPSKQRITTVVIKNRFLENLKYGIFAMEGSETQILSNDFQGELCGVGGGSGSSIQVSENVFSRCCVGVHLATDTNFQVIRNQFTDANELGVYSSGGTGNVLRNVFSLCIIAGVCVEQNGAPTVSRNLFAFNASTEFTSGIFTRRGGGGFFSDNDIHENAIGIRCDNNGLGTFSNCFVHDNTLGLHAMSGGKCTISQTFFTGNRIADVFSSHGGAPILNRCVLYDSPKPFLIRDFGGGIFSFNVMKNVEGSAVLVQFPSVAAHEARVAEVQARKKKELQDAQQLLKMVLNMDDTISRAGVAMLSTVEPRTLNTIYRVSPTFSSNLVVNCGAGIEIDLGDTPKDRLSSKVRKSSSHEGEGGAVQKPGGKLSKQKSNLASVVSSASLKASRGAPTGEDDDTGGGANQTRKAKAEQQARYVSPMPDLQTLTRGDYWAFFTQNVVQQCITGVLVHKGTVDRPPKFRPLYDNVSTTVAQADEATKEVLNGPSMEEFDSDSDPKTATLMTDDVFMVHFDGNTILSDDVGITVRHGGNARFERNYITKCMRSGILISDEGRGEFFENVVTECTTGYCLNVLGDTMRGVSSTSILPCFANFQCNVFSSGKTCATISAPEIRMVKNRFYGGEQGVMIYPAAGGLFHLNIIYENRRVGCVCMSESAILTANWFYSPQENSAIEMQIDSSSVVGNRIPPGNAVKNQFTPRLAKPEPANKISLTSDHVSEVRSAKDQRDLFHVLRELHDAQLPSCGATGCNRIGVYASKDQLEAFVQAKRRVMAAKVVVTEHGIVREPPTKPQGVAAHDPSVRGIQFNEPEAHQDKMSYGVVLQDGHDQSVFGGLATHSNQLTGTMFRASSSRFGRQTEGGLGPAGGQRVKSIVTMDEMRQELRKKREDREAKNAPERAESGGRRKSSASKRRKSSGRRRSSARKKSMSDDDAPATVVPSSPKVPQTKRSSAVSSILPSRIKAPSSPTSAAPPTAWEQDVSAEPPGNYTTNTTETEDTSDGGGRHRGTRGVTGNSASSIVKVSDDESASGTPRDRAMGTPRERAVGTPREGPLPVPRPASTRRQSTPRQALSMSPRVSVPTLPLDPPQATSDADVDGSPNNAQQRAVRQSPPPAPPVPAPLTSLDVGGVPLRSAAPSPTSTKMTVQDRMKALDASFGGGSVLAESEASIRDASVPAPSGGHRFSVVASAVASAISLDTRKKSAPPPAAPSGGREAAAKKIRDALQSRKADAGPSLLPASGLSGTSQSVPKPTNATTFRSAAGPVDKWAMNRGTAKPPRTSRVSYPTKALNGDTTSYDLDALERSDMSTKTSYGVLETKEAPNFTVSAATSRRGAADDKCSPVGSPLGVGRRGSLRGGTSSMEPSAVLEASGKDIVLSHFEAEEVQGSAVEAASNAPAEVLPTAPVSTDAGALSVPTAASPPPNLAADTPLLGLPSPAPMQRSEDTSEGGRPRLAETTPPVAHNSSSATVDGAHQKCAAIVLTTAAGKPPIPVVKASTTITPPPLLPPTSGGGARSVGRRAASGGAAHVSPRSVVSGNGSRRRAGSASVVAVVVGATDTLSGESTTENNAVTNAPLPATRSTPANVALGPCRPSTGSTRLYHVQDLQFHESDDDDIVEQEWLQQQKRRALLLSSANSSRRKVPPLPTVSPTRAAPGSNPRRPHSRDDGGLRRMGSDVTETALATFPGSLLRISADSPRRPSDAPAFPDDLATQRRPQTTSTAVKLRVSPERTRRTSPPASRPPVFRHTTDDDGATEAFSNGEPLSVAPRRTSPPARLDGAQPMTTGSAARLGPAPLTSPIPRHYNYAKRPSTLDAAAAFPALSIAYLGGSSSPALPLAAGVDDAILVTGRDTSPGQAGATSIRSPRPPVISLPPRTVTIQSHKDEPPPLSISGHHASSAGFTRSSHRGSQGVQDLDIDTKTAKDLGVLEQQPQSDSLLLDGVVVTVPMPNLIQSATVVGGGLPPRKSSHNSRTPQHYVLPPALVASIDTQPPQRREHIIFGDVEDERPFVAAPQQPTARRSTPSWEGVTTTERAAMSGGGSSSRGGGTASGTPSYVHSHSSTSESNETPRKGGNTSSVIGLSSQRPTSGLPGTFVQRGISSTFVPYHQ